MRPQAPELRVGIVGYGVMGKAHSYGYRVTPMLRRLMRSEKREEVRTRLGAMLVELGTPARSPETLRDLRAVEVLGRIGSAGAREALERAAKARAGSLVGARAADAVKRLTSR